MRCRDAILILLIIRIILIKIARPDGKVGKERKGQELEKENGNKEHGEGKREEIEDSIEWAENPKAGNEIL